jgi:hypothetical protein
LADHPARLFVCARCRAQVLLCSHCDRGQRYCGRACSRTARQGSQREAARRYQRSRGGRMAHAARSRRWRMRQRSREQPAPSTLDTNNVTHQGSQVPGGDASLAPCEREHADSIARTALLVIGVAGEPACAAPNVTPTREYRWCRRCARALSPWVRQGFMRHGPGSRWPGRAHDHDP